MTAAYEVWTGTEQVHKEQLSIFSSNTRTGEHHMKVLGRGYEQEKGNIFHKTQLLSRTYCRRSTEMGVFTQNHR